jgi:hypothetical protein
MRCPWRVPRTILVTAIVIGCWAPVASAGPRTFRRLYTGPPRPRKEVAFVLSMDESILSEINGTSLTVGTFWKGYNTPGGCEILPGPYSFCVGYMRESGFGGVKEVVESDGCANQSVTLLPGHVYVVTTEFVIGNSLSRPVFRDASEWPDVVGVSVSGGGVSVNARDRRASEWLRKALAQVDEYFKGEREVSIPVATILESQAGSEAETIEDSRVWNSLVPGYVLELTLEGKTFVVVVDKRKDDALIYYAPGDAGNTYRLARSAIRRLKVLAASPEEYAAAPRP